MVGAPIFFFLTLIDSLGDCAPDVNCHKGFWSSVALPTIAAGVIVGLLIRTIINRFASKDS